MGRIGVERFFEKSRGKVLTFLIWRDIIREV